MTFSDVITHVPKSYIFSDVVFDVAESISDVNLYNVANKKFLRHGFYDVAKT